MNNPSRWCQRRFATIDAMRDNGLVTKVTKGTSGAALMPDQRRHRGAHPEDARLFAATTWPLLQQAVEHLAWHLTRGYAATSSIKLVGDRFRLAARQRLAVRRATCADHARSARAAKCRPLSQLAGQRVAIDGFNLITTVEAALSRGVLLSCRDRCIRDMASMHGNYRQVSETLRALKLIGQVLARGQVAHCTWWLDRPVSNSGRLSSEINNLGRQNGWPWQSVLALDVDHQLSASSDIVVSADSVVLDRCHQWSNIAPAVIDQIKNPLWMVPMVP